MSCGGGPADLSAAFLSIIGRHVVVVPEVVLRQVRRAVWVQVEAAAAVVEAVVDETAHVLTAGDAGPELADTLDASGGGVYGRWLSEEHEHAIVAKHRVREGIRRDGAAGVEVEIAALVLAPVPGAGAMLHASVAHEELAVVVCLPLQLVPRVVGGMVRDHRRSVFGEGRHGVFVEESGQQ